MINQEEYIIELQELHHRRVNYILLAGGFLILLFASLDYLMIPELFTEFFIYRQALIVITLLLLILNYSDKAHKHPHVIGFLFFILVSLVIIFMIYRMGGVTSPYSVGLIVCMAVYSSLAPLTTSQCLVACFSVVTFYSITIFYTHSLHQVYLMDFFNNLFFMISFIFIIATQSWADTRARKREFQLRMLENNAAEELQELADVLQKEVEKRSKEHRATEKSYQLLFDQIADDAIVLGPRGEILQANVMFERHFGNGGSITGKSLFDLVVRHQQKDFQQTINRMFRDNSSLSGHKVLLCKNDHTFIEAEINASQLVRDQSSSGILLMIRDTSTRKELERKLFRSLEIKKKTETAAIMALAKLSEFRDISTTNHLERIREYCKLIATELSHRSTLGDVMTPTYIEDIYHASILHDIGKVAIPDTLIFNKKQLTERERDTVRRHTIIGGDVIKEMEEESKGSGFLAMAKHIAYFHHERWDGKGYPYGLIAREIPLAARIMTIADAYEAMTSSSKKEAVMSHGAAINHLSELSGLKFDPMVVEAFLAKNVEINQVRQTYSL